MALKMLWSALAALLLALLSGFDVSRAARPAAAVGTGAVDSGFGTATLRHLHDTGTASEPVPERETKEASNGVTKRVFKGFVLQRTASCPAGMTLAEVLECSAGNTKFVKVVAENKVVDGEVIGFTCGCVACQFPCRSTRVAGCYGLSNCKLATNCDVLPHTRPRYTRERLSLYLIRLSMCMKVGTCA